MRIVCSVRAGLALGLLCCALLPGCKLFERRAEEDPMKGQWPAAPPTAEKGKDAPKAGDAPAQDNSTAPPPLPVPSTASVTSLAALTSGANQTLEPRAPAPGPVTGTLTSNPGQSPGIALAPPQPGAPVPGTAATAQPPVVLMPPIVLGNPEPAGPPGSPTPPPPVVAPPPDPGFRSVGAPPVVQTFDQAHQELQARGVNVNNQNLEQIGPDTWRFSCTIPDYRDSNHVTPFQATAPGEGGLAAIRAVLDQIDKAPR
jgi:hypothetical protein